MSTNQHGKLNGKVAIVTGASKGIGAEIARAFGAAGASVVVNYASSKTDADRVVAQILEHDGKAIAVQADVSKAADVERLFAETKRAFGSLDVLVNNAGIYEFEPLESVSEAAFQRTFATNVLGPILTTREALKYFGKQGGSVINVGSVATSTTPANTVVYSASKGGVDALTRVLAKELGPRGIRVNSINPGPVETEGLHRAGIKGSEMEAQMVAQTPLGRIGQPNDIAPIAVFLASADAGWLSGETIFAAGGFR